MTSGYIQGFLLYSHILCSLSISSNIHVPSKEFYAYWDFLHILYFPFTLKFFYLPKLSFCISPDATNLDVAALGYVKGFYSAVLVFIVVAFLKCFASYCRGFNRCLRFTTAKNSVLIGMSALYVLSFTSSVEISLQLLQPAPLYEEDYRVLNYRVALYGSEVYFGPHHLKYALLAIFCLFVLLIPAAMLLTYSLVLHFLSYCRLDADQSYTGFFLTKGYMYAQLKPFYDMFYARFKGNHRYFAGIYFFYRIMIQVPYDVPNNIESSFIMETLLICFLVMHAIVQPYQKRCHNIIDAFLLSDLVIINGLTCANMIIAHNSEETHFWNVNIASNFQVILAVLPMCVVLCYVIWKYLLSCLWKKLINYLYLDNIGTNGS